MMAAGWHFREMEKRGSPGWLDYHNEDTQRRALLLKVFHMLPPVPFQRIQSASIEKLVSEFGGAGFWRNRKSDLWADWRYMFGYTIEECRVWERAIFYARRAVEGGGS